MYIPNKNTQRIEEPNVSKSIDSLAKKYSPVDTISESDDLIKIVMKFSWGDEFFFACSFTQFPIIYVQHLVYFLKFQQVLPGQI